MVAPQSRTLVRYRNMIARQPPTPLGCAPAAHEQGTCVRDGPSRSQAHPREHTSTPVSLLLPLEYLMALAEGGVSGLPPARILVA